MCHLFQPREPSGTTQTTRYPDPQCWGRSPASFSDEVVDLLTAVRVGEAGSVLLVILVSVKALVAVGPGPSYPEETASVPSPGKHERRNLKGLPDPGVVGRRRGAGRDVPAESHTARERAALRAALPCVVRLGRARGRHDAAVACWDVVAEGAAVGVVGTVLGGRKHH